MLDRTALTYAKLQANINMSDLEKDWLAGYEAAQANVEEDSNPYEMDTQEYHQWNEGWWAGFYEEEKVFNWNEPTNETVSSVIHRIQSVSTQVNTLKANTVKQQQSLVKRKHRLVAAHLVQFLAAVLAFGLCAQFADILM